MSKLIERLKRRPKDFTWDEACTLMRLCGFEQLNGSGSRRRFVHLKTRIKISLHEPHPQPTLLPYAIKDLLQALRETGEIDDDESL